MYFTCCKKWQPPIFNYLAFLQFTKMALWCDKCIYKCLNIPSRQYEITKTACRIINELEKCSLKQLHCRIMQCVCVFVRERLENVNITGHEKGTLVHSSVQQELPGAFNLLLETVRNNLIPDSASVFLCLMKKCECLNSLCVALDRDTKWYFSSLKPAARYISERHIVCKEAQPQAKYCREYLIRQCLTETGTSLAKQELGASGCVASFSNTQLKMFLFWQTDAWSIRNRNLMVRDWKH